MQVSVCAFTKLMNDKRQVIIKRSASHITTAIALSDYMIALSHMCQSKVQHTQLMQKTHEIRSRWDHKRLRNPRKRQNRCRFSLSFSHFYNRQCIALDSAIECAGVHEKQQKKSKLRVGKMRTSLILSFLFLLVALFFFLSSPQPFSVVYKENWYRFTRKAGSSSIKRSERKKRTGKERILNKL